MLAGRYGARRRQVWTVIAFATSPGATQSTNVAITGVAQPTVLRGSRAVVSRAQDWLLSFKSSRLASRSAIRPVMRLVSAIVAANKAVTIAAHDGEKRARRGGRRRLDAGQEAWWNVDGHEGVPDRGARVEGNVR